MKFNINSVDFVFDHRHVIDLLNIHLSILNHISIRIAYSFYR